MTDIMTEPQPPAGPPLRLRRRSVLLGVGAAAIAPGGSSPAGGLQLFFRDDNRRDEIVIRRPGKQDVVWTTASFGPAASFKLTRESVTLLTREKTTPPPQHGATLEWTPAKWLVEVQDAAFPGGRLHQLAFSFERTPDKVSKALQPWTVQAQSYRWPVEDKSRPFQARSADEFLQGKVLLETAAPLPAATAPGIVIS